MQKVFAILFLLLHAGLAAAQNYTRPAQKFPRMGKTIPVGAYYYPEQWSPEQWDRDLKRMSELGISFTHLAEFAWSRIEPTEGKYEWNWLDRVVDLAGRHNLKVIMCTPTCTPPPWMFRNHPEVFVVGSNGKPMELGNRRHASNASPFFQEASRKVVKAMADRYGDNKAVIGWQIDNEPHVAWGYDYSPAAEAAFRVWLKAKYGSVDSLNKSWGGSFWSQEYNTFDQVKLPNKDQGDVNHHQMVDFQLYTGQDMANLLNLQAEILKKYTRDQFVTTNYMNFRTAGEYDPFYTKSGLDLTAYTYYPLGSYNTFPDWEKGIRYGSGLEMAYCHDLAASVHGGRTGIMELQPGQINWARVNPLPEPGAVRLWMYHNLGMGNDFICTYRYRQPLFGAEQYHQGLMGPNGVTLTEGGKEYVEAIRVFEQLKTQADPKAELPPDIREKRTAIVWDPASGFDIGQNPWNQDFDYNALVLNYYRAARAAGAQVRFVPLKDKLDPKEYPYAIVPAVQLAGTAEVAKWKAYAEAGGHLIISCRTAHKDRQGHLHQTRLGEFLRPLTGCLVEDVDQLPASKTASIKGLGGPHKFHIWGELLDVGEYAEAFAHYENGFYAGKAAATYRKLGRGSATYVGAFTQGGTLEKAAVFEAYRRGGQKVQDLPDQVFIDWHEGLWTCVNYSGKPYRVQGIPINSKLVGSEDVAPGGVFVWK